MKDQTSSELVSVLTYQAPARIAVIGAGVAGLTCARELCLRRYDPVVS